MSLWLHPRLIFGRHQRKDQTLRCLWLHHRLIFGRHPSAGIHRPLRGELSTARLLTLPSQEDSRLSRPHALLSPS